MSFFLNNLHHFLVDRDTIKTYWVGDGTSFMFMTKDELTLLRYFTSVRDLSMTLLMFRDEVVSHIQSHWGKTYYKDIVIDEVEWVMPVCEVVLRINDIIVFAVNSGYIFIDKITGDLIATYIRGKSSSPLVAQFLLQFPNIRRRGLIE